MRCTRMKVRVSVDEGREDLLHSKNLGCRQASWAIARQAVKGFGVELASARVFENTVCGAVKRVTLLLDFLVNELPVFGGEIRIRGIGAQDGLKSIAIPRYETIVIDNRSSGDDSIEQLGMRLRGPSALRKWRHTLANVSQQHAKATEGLQERVPRA